jgi:hypothetical protein
VPLGLAGCAAALVALFLVGTTTPPAQAAPLAPEAAAGFQTTEKLILTVNLPGSPKNTKGTLRVELIGRDDKVLAQDERTVEATDEATTHRFELASPKVAADQITLRCRFGKEETTLPLSKVLLAKAHETVLTSGQEFFAGSQAALRCQVQGVKSATETVPLPGAAVEVRLQPKQGEAITLFSGKTGAEGVAAVPFKVPALPAGSYKLSVVTKSDFGEEKLERDVKVKTAPKVLLVTDKPLYQPGQLMHLRALALQSFDRTPVGGAEIVFEVEDAKGNKVFKKPLKTSEHGIASVDFQLADEVNTGDYRIRAVLGEHQADKTVTVKPYVLPKFKTELTADKKFYLPKETVQADLQVDYFFGKPVAGGNVKVTASTFDVAFKEFQTWEGKTDAQGHVKFEVKLPDYFVGQPLQKGNALVRLEVKVTDTADHTEVLNRTFPVSDQAVKVSLIPEGGRLVPGLENRVFAAAVYPDGSPAPCEVHLWRGQKADGKPFATVKTNESGLAEFRITPRADQFRAGEWAERKVEMLGGQVPAVWAPKNLFDLFAEAKDVKGNQAHAAVALTSEPLGENLLLRLDKAIYKGGDSITIDVRTSAGQPTVYLDVIRAGQTLLTKWLDVKDGKAGQKLDLPPGVFGTLEVHAYQVLPSGEIIRDSRVVYAHAPTDLQIEVKADKDVYVPGEAGKIQFQVTDARGQPTAAALGILIVDEAVYALQEMQPGLEKVYFTLQEELLKPQAQAVFKPSENIDTLVRQPVLTDAKQQVAEVLLTAVQPKPPARWEVNPNHERRQKMEAQINQIGWALFNYAQTKSILVQDKQTKAWGFAPDLLQKLVEEKQLGKDLLNDPVGGTLTLEGLARVEKNFTPDRLARGVTGNRLQQLYWAVNQYTEQNRGKWFKDGKWTLPETVVADAARAHGQSANDGWGSPIKLVPLDEKRVNAKGQNIYDFFELASAGADGKFGTDDDVPYAAHNQWWMAQMWWLGDEARKAQQGQQLALRNGQGIGGGPWRGLAGGPGMPGGGMRGGGFGGPPGGAGGFPGGPPVPQAGGGPPLARDARESKGADPKSETAAGAAPAMRLREYFPETMLWQPALITDDRGRASLPLTFADSITTWRMTASASSRGGALGGVSTPLRVFQDFFVDLDLPIALTQNDEVAFPVAVYNYLKTPQTVTLDLQPESWFELTDGLGLKRSLDLKANEVTAVKFRIRAKRIGNFPLTVKASGTKMSDAIKRSIEVVPDGRKVDQVVADRLSGTVTKTLTIPDNAIGDASKLYVKVYPGVFSQVLEGTEGMLRLPGG